MKTFYFLLLSAAPKGLPLGYAFSICGIILVMGAVIARAPWPHFSDTAPRAQSDRPALSKAVGYLPHYYYVVGSPAEGAAISSSFYNTERIEPNFDFLIVTTGDDERRLAATERELQEMELERAAQGDLRPGAIFVDLRPNPPVE
jgi:hypothetical protein